MRTCSAFSGLWRIGAAAYLGRSLTTQGGASLYPGLSHYAPLGRTIRLRIGVQKTRGQSPCFLGVYPARAQTQLPGGLGQVPRRWLRVKRNSRGLEPKQLTGFVAGAPTSVSVWARPFGRQRLGASSWTIGFSLWKIFPGSRLIGFDGSVTIASLQDPFLLRSFF